MATPTPALQISDRPLNKKLLAELQSIASAMGLDTGDLKKTQNLGLDSGAHQ
jgi:hypothetical protein